MESVDYLIIGGGIAGASAGYFLADHGSVLILEQESQPGYHTTGRSAALFSETYGNRVIRGLSAAGRSFFESPPTGFADHPLLTPRGALFIGRADQTDRLDEAAEEGRALTESVRRMDADEVLATIPSLRPDYVAGGVIEPEAMDIDVHALHHGFLRGLRAKGGRVVTDAPVTGLSRIGGGWDVATRASDFRGTVVVNAAGAWCDAVAELAGAGPVGLVPKRRTIIQFDAPAGLNIDGWPMCGDIDEEFYFKPDAGRFIGSPADETPSPPCDAQPEDLDIAICVDRITQAADFHIPRIKSSWAGLRSFVADKTPVVGFDPRAEGFFWLAGQGGYGIQTAPSMGRVAAALATGGDIPDDIQARGVTAAALDPARSQAAAGSA
jgi:D-arginine dehydrogenase